MPLQKALRRASRKAFMWREEAASILQQGRPLTELPAIGPTLDRIIRGWFENPPDVPTPPPIRQHFFTATETHATLAENPEWQPALKGDLQMHTVWSDGSGSIEDMARSAVDRGYEFIAITDHSKGLSIANGIDEAKLKQQSAEIEAVNRELGSAGEKLTVLRSIEMNLNPAGKGDMDAKALRSLDLVLGSFHSALRRKDDQTERYLAALRNPDIQILGHPRGRIYNYRLGLKADWARVFNQAAKLDKALEIDCYPDRQDLNLSLLKIARREGVRISLGTDAHHPWQLEFITLGLAAALKAKIPADRIINFLPLGEVKRWVTKLRERSQTRKRTKS